MDLELCITTFEEAEVAKRYGFTRVELCAALELGGLTPGFGLIKNCVNLDGPQVHAMIRPRPGGFVHRAKEIEIMKDEIRAASQAGAHGVVFGVLNEQNGIHREHIAELTTVARDLNLEITFHRAFDLSNDPFSAIDILIENKITRLLTSGLKPTVNEGMPTIQKLIDQAKSKIQIMAGSGVNEGNASLLKMIGADAIHFSARKSKHAHDELGMGREYTPNIKKIEGILKVI